MHIVCDNYATHKTPLVKNWLTAHKNIQTLERDIRTWATGWNENPKPFIWTKTAEQILESLVRLMKRTTGAGHELFFTRRPFSTT